MKKSCLFVGVLALLTVSSFANDDNNFKCSSILKSMNLKKESTSIGLFGALEVKDTSTNEKVRIFLSQTGQFKSTINETYDFVVSGIKSISNKGILFDELDERTNIQLLNITYPGFPSKGCFVTFSGRQFGTDSTLIMKYPSRLGVNSFVLKANERDSELGNELIINYHDIDLD